MSMAYIYALVDPITFEIRYIGKTNNQYQRYHQHLSENNKTYKCHWVQSLLARGLLPILQILEEVDDSCWVQINPKRY